MTGFLAAVKKSCFSLVQSRRRLTTIGALEKTAPAAAQHERLRIARLRGLIAVHARGGVQTAMALITGRLSDLRKADAAEASDTAASLTVASASTAGAAAAAGPAAAPKTAAETEAERLKDSLEGLDASFDPSELHHLPLNTILHFRISLSTQSRQIPYEGHSLCCRGISEHVLVCDLAAAW